MILSLKRRNLAQANYTEKFTLQISRDQDTTHLSEFFEIKHMLSS